MNDVERALSDAASRLPAEAESDRIEWLAELAGLAGERGLLDLAYGSVDSPLGPLTVVVSRRGLIRLAYPDEPVDRLLQRLSDSVSPRVLEAPAAVEPVARQLEQYFEGRRDRFEIGIDWTLTRGFGRRVLRATARIPFGRVASYRTVAVDAGSPRATRAAGNALGANPIPIVVPCHRVVRTGGGLGGYTGGLDRKRFLLRLEGVAIPG